MLNVQHCSLSEIVKNRLKFVACRSKWSQLHRHFDSLCVWKECVYDISVYMNLFYCRRSLFFWFPSHRAHQYYTHSTKRLANCAVADSLCFWLDFAWFYILRPRREYFSFFFVIRIGSKYSSISDCGLSSLSSVYVCLCDFNLRSKFLSSHT